MAKPKIPKKIGGVKVPKKVRRQAKKAIKLVESPVREFAISGLTAAAEALAQRTASELRAAGQTQRRASLAALDLGDMLREAAIEGARRFLSGFEDARRTAARPARAASPARKPKAAAKPAAKKAPAKPAAKPKAAARAKAVAKAAPKPAARPVAKKPAAKKPASKPGAAKPSAAKRKPTGRSGGGRAAPA